MQQLGGWGEAMHVGGGGDDRVDQAGVHVRPKVHFHSVGKAFRAPLVPLVALLGEVHLRIPPSVLVLSGAGRSNQGVIHDYALLHRHTPCAEAGYVGLRGLLT